MSDDGCLNVCYFKGQLLPTVIVAIQTDRSILMGIMLLLDQHLFLCKLSKNICKKNKQKNNMQKNQKKKKNKKKKHKKWSWWNTSI